MRIENIAVSRHVPSARSRSRRTSPSKVAPSLAIAAREAVQIARLRALAEESHLDPAFAEKFLNFIVAEVIHHHVQIATGSIDTA